MSSSARNVRTQCDPRRPRERERKASLRGGGPRVDAVRTERAELVDELHVVVEAWYRRSAGLAIEQPRADAVADLATAALLVDRVHRDRKSTRLNSSHLGISY